MTHSANALRGDRTLIVIVGGLFAAMAIISVLAERGAQGVAGAALAAIMLAVAVSDLRRYRVPDPLVALALILREVAVFLDREPALAIRDTTLRALIAGGVLWLFRVAYASLRGREGLGLGDVKLAAVAGAWVGWRLLPWVLEAAAIVGLTFALFRGRAALHASARVPFAVGFAPAIWLGWWFDTLV